MMGIVSSDENKIDGMTGFERKKDDLNRKDAKA